MSDTANAGSDTSTSTADARAVAGTRAGGASVAERGVGLALLALGVLDGVVGGTASCVSMLCSMSWYHLSKPMYGEGTYTYRQTGRYQ